MTTDSRPPDLVRKRLFSPRAPCVTVTVEHTEGAGSRAHYTYPVELGRLVQMHLLDHEGSIETVLFPAYERYTGFARYLFSER